MLVIKNKKKFIRGITLLLISLVIIISIIWSIISSIISVFSKDEDKPEADIAKQTQTNTIQNDVNTIADNINETNTVVTNTTDSNITAKVSTNANSEVLNQWNLKLVNKDNSVSRDYVPELEELDDGVMFDKRVISYVEKMINAMYADGLTGFWVQSAYRSYDKQEELFNKKVKYYKDQGKEQEEAEELAQKVVQRPEMSEHNLGLAADFNTVTNEFENTKAFKWLKENAEDYGFILRYPKDKQEITGITYESWHWRYVGEEHAKAMNEKGYCLEEYIEYLSGAEEV